MVNKWLKLRFDATKLLHFCPKQMILMSKVATEEAKDAPDQSKIKSLERAIGVIQKTETKTPTTEVAEGVFLFVLAKLSSTVCGETPISFDLCVEISDGAGSAGSSSGSTKQYAASLKRPKTQAQMFCLLHQFVMVSVACGITTVMALCPFLDDVVYEPVRMGTLDWPVAFELMVCYFRLIENEPSRWRANVRGRNYSAYGIYMYIRLLLSRRNHWTRRAKHASGTYT